MLHRKWDVGIDYWNTRFGHGWDNDYYTIMIVFTTSSRTRTKDVGHDLVYDDDLRVLW